MAETEYKPSSKLTLKERKLKFKYARLLRDIMLKTLEEWKTIVQNELASEKVDPQSIEKNKR